MPVVPGGISAPGTASRPPPVPTGAARGGPGSGAAADVSCAGRGGVRGAAEPSRAFFSPVFQVTDGLLQRDVSSEAVPVPAPAPQPARRSDPDWGLAVTLNKSSSRLAL